MTAETEESGDEGPLTIRYGWVVMANPLGQLIFSPVFGWIAGRMGSIRLVCLASSASYFIGNVLYSTLTLLDEGVRFGMLMFCRFLIGVASGKHIFNMNVFFNKNVLFQPIQP